MNRFIGLILTLCCFHLAEPMVLALAAPAAVPVISAATVGAVVRTTAALSLAVGGLYSFIPGIKRGKNRAVVYRKNNNNNYCWCGCGPCESGCGCPCLCVCASRKQHKVTYTYEHGTYEDAGYHHKNSNGNGKSGKSQAPKDAQKALDNSIFLSGNGTERIGVSANQIVVLSKTATGLYHGHVISLLELRSTLFSNDFVFSLQENLKSFSHLLEQALSNRLQLHHSLKLNGKKDIGYFFNESRQGKSGIFLDDEGYWIGMRHIIQGASDVIAWLYNDDNGEIIFELTPNFPGENTYHFDGEMLSSGEQKNLARYEQWVTTYKPVLKRVIPLEVAQKWLKQANLLLRIIERNNVSCGEKK